MGLKDGLVRLLLPVTFALGVVKKAMKSDFAHSFAVWVKSLWLDFLWLKRKQQLTCLRCCKMDSRNCKALRFEGAE